MVRPLEVAGPAVLPATEPGSVGDRAFWPFAAVEEKGQMSEKMEQGKFWQMYQDLKAGRISRRQFMQGATALGVGLPVTAFVLNSIKISPASAAGPAALQTTGAARPAEGTEGQTRGAGGELKMLQWQAATHASLHTSTGTKDSLAASLVTEPLMNYLPDASLVPTLVKEVPSVENGLLAEDLSTVTYNLLEGVTWSDGEPFTAADVVFTWQWIMNPDNASVSVEPYAPIENVEAVDDLTVMITFTTPSLGWYIPFTGTYNGAIYPKHILETGKDAINEFRQKPTGTGPYVVESLTENDQVIYVANPNYREPNKPFFAKINLKGGGDAASAATAVLQTGDWDFAWNLQVEPQILTDLEKGGKGKVVVSPGTNIERVLINFSDPNTEVDGQRSEKSTPHPFFADKAVRQALSLATDRDTISAQFYSGPPGEPATPNILVGIPAYLSPNTSFKFDLEEAKATLEAAGWTGEGTRSKDGVELKVSYQTSINAVRQKTQALNKQNWEKVGFDVQLKQIDAGIYFDSAAGNDQNASHFYADVEMYTNGATTPYPTSYFAGWYGGEDGKNIAQKANDWSGLNESRWSNADYDALYESLAAETDPEKAAETFIKLNDILINEVVIIPMVQRAAEKYAILNTLNEANIAGSPWEALYWNAANWNRVS
jgi:peptide/nickel transport system substrate-binding protein